MEEGPNSGPDGGRMLREVACSAASGDGTDGDGTPGASDGTTPTVLRRLVLTSISHLLRLLRLSTTDDTSPGCFGMILSVWWSASRMFTVGSNVVAAAAVDDGGDAAGSGRFELIADSCGGFSPQSTSVMLAPMDAVVQGPLPAKTDEDVTGCSLLLLVVVAVTGIDIDVIDAPEVHVDGLLT